LAIIISLSVRNLVETPNDAICPSCGEKMEKGWLAANKRIYWNATRPGWFGGSLGAERLGKGFWAPDKVAAYRCKSCRLIRYYPPEFDWD
jgi:hypothetical protein